MSKKMFRFRLMIVAIVVAVIISLTAPAFASVDSSSANELVISFGDLSISASTSPQTVDLKVYVNQDILINALSWSHASTNSNVVIDYSSITFGANFSTEGTTSKTVTARNAGADLTLTYDTEQEAYLLATIPLTIAANYSGTSTINLTAIRAGCQSGNYIFASSHTIRGSVSATITVSEAEPEYSINYLYNKSYDPLSSTQNHNSSDAPLTGSFETGASTIKLSEGLPEYDIPYFNFTNWTFNETTYTSEQALLSALEVYYTNNPSAAPNVTYNFQKQVYYVEILTQVGEEGTPTSAYNSSDYGKCYDVGSSVKLTAPATYGGQDFAYWQIGDDAVYARTVYYMGTSAAGADDPLQLTAVYLTPEEEEEEDTTVEPTLSIANVYSDRNAGKYRIIATVELAGAPDGVTINAVGFKYTVNTTEGDKGPVTGSWTDKPSAALAAAGAGSYTVKFNMGTTVTAKTKPLYLCGYVRYTVNGDTYTKYIGFNADDVPISAVAEDDPAGASTCYKIYRWNALS